MEKIKIAAFDFDGTLTYRDTLIPFLLFVCGPWKLFKECLLLTPVFVGYIFKIYDRQQVKEALMSRTIAGMPLEKVRALGAEFAQNRLPQLLRPEGMERLRWHQERGDRALLVSANLDVYLEPWGKIVGFQDVICSKVAQDNFQRVTGKLIGKNCRAQEKVVRLEQLLGGRSIYEVYAYGDSEGDKEMLEWADFPYYNKFH